MVVSEYFGVEEECKAIFKTICEKYLEVEVINKSKFDRICNEMVQIRNIMTINKKKCR
jgi:hypothetical protein